MGSSSVGRPDVVLTVPTPQDVVACGHGGVQAGPKRVRLVTAGRDETHDWTYRAAWRRLLRAARAQLRKHVAVAGLDARGNRIVSCGCGWRGNGLGWADHLDSVMRLALDGEVAR